MSALGYLLLRSPSRAPLAGATFTQLTDHPGQELYPSLSPDGNYFLYASRAAGNWDIYLQRVGGRNAINLTKDCPFDDTQPAFSPDGQRIAFRSERDGGGIFVMGATGESVKRVSDLGYYPAWSPHGREIVCATANFWTPDCRRGAGSQLLLVHLEASPGPARKRLVAGPNDAVQPSWSPHGHRIAYWDLRGENRDILTVPAAGGQPVPVTADPHLDWNPVWSPDGNYLYFASNRGGSMNFWRVRIAFQSTRSGKYEIWTINPDGSGLRQVTSTPGFLWWTFWSPDGKRLGSSVEGGTSLLVDPDKPWKAQSPEALPSFSEVNTSFKGFSWSADGRRLAGHLVTAEGVSAGIAAYSFASRKYERLTAFGGYPVWLSDNRRLVFRYYDKLCLVDSRTKKVRELLAVTPQSIGGGLAVSRDDREIYFSLRISEADIWPMSLR